MSSLPERISKAVGEMLGFGDEPEIARVVMRVLAEAPPEQILNLVGDVVLHIPSGSATELRGPAVCALLTPTEPGGSA